MNYGNWIKCIREAHKLTQEELGDILGVSHHAISKWETGINNPPIELFFKFCDLFHLSLDDMKKSEKYKPIDLKDEFGQFKENGITGGVKEAAIDQYLEWWVYDDLCCKNPVYKQAIEAWYKFAIYYLIEFHSDHPEMHHNWHTVARLGYAGLTYCNGSETALERIVKNDEPRDPNARCLHWFRIFNSSDTNVKQDILSRYRKVTKTESCIVDNSVQSMEEIIRWSRLEERIR